MGLIPCHMLLAHIVYFELFIPCEFLIATDSSLIKKYISSSSELLRNNVSKIFVLSIFEWLFYTDFTIELKETVSISFTKRKTHMYI